jgi:hypothetical protein
MSVFKTFEIGLGIFSKLKKIYYRDRKVLEFLETCRSTKICFAHSLKKLGKNPLVPFSPVQPD